MNSQMTLQSAISRMDDCRSGCDIGEPFYADWEAWDVIRAHLTQPAQAVDVGAVEALWHSVDRMIVDAWKLGGCEKPLDMLAMRARFDGAQASLAPPDAVALLRETARYLDPRHYSEIVGRISAYVAKGTVVHAGWKLVPIEPNWDMRNEGRELLIDGVEKEPERLAYVLWKAMLNASPALTAALPKDSNGAEGAAGWRPIATAPKDGKEVLVAFTADGVRQVAEASWSDDEDVWVCSRDGFMLYRRNEPTHWMPLPEPPTNGKKEQEVE